MNELKERWHYQAPLPQGAIDVGQVILRDGTTAELRPVGPGDRALIESFLQRTSADARYHFRNADRSWREREPRQWPVAKMSISSSSLRATAPGGKERRSK